MSISPETTDYLKFLSETRFCYESEDVQRLVTSAEELERFSVDHKKKLGVIYRSGYNILSVDLVERAGGELIPFERVVKTSSGNAIVILAKRKGKYALIKQFRHCLGAYQLALPRGNGEPGISAEDNAKKELLEELGTVALHVKCIGEVVADSGLCGERVKVVVCEIGDPMIRTGYEGIAWCEFYSIEQLKKLVKDGAINDGFTLSALAMLLAQGG